MRPGNYRLRFTHDTSITLERDITLRAGESLSVDVSLSPAPPPPPPPEPVKAPEPARTLAPPGEPRVTPIPLFLEKNFIGGREGRKESSLGCSGTGTATLHQLREAWLAHTHEDADEWIYVVAGEGTLRIGTNDNRLQAGVFSLVPRTASHAVIPAGRNPLIIISVFSGPQCKG
jgi:mannose-6-phosphate isomerase-like protein (cupin superfamily)